MRHLITNLSSVPNEKLQATLAERLELLPPGPERERSFGDAARYAASALDLRAVVEFRPERAWATFTDLTDSAPVSFALAENGIEAGKAATAPVVCERAYRST